MTCRDARTTPFVLGSVLLAAALPGCAESGRREPAPVLAQADSMSEAELKTADESLRRLDQWMQIECYNLANMSTPGFKALRAVHASEEFRPGESSGARLLRPLLDMSQGSPVTSGSFDILIAGQGLFQVEVGGKSGVAFTRDGRFVLNADRELVTLVGSHAVLPRVTLPLRPAGVTISPDGRLLVLPAGSKHPQEIGQFVLARFSVPEALTPITGTLFAETVESGRPCFGQPDDGELGSLMQGSYECSNVDPTAVALNLERIRRLRALWDGSTPESRRREFQPISPHFFAREGIAPDRD